MLPYHRRAQQNQQVRVQGSAIKPFGSQVIM